MSKRKSNTTFPFVRLFISLSLMGIGLYFCFVGVGLWKLLTGFAAWVVGNVSVIEHSDYWLERWGIS